MCHTSSLSYFHHDDTRGYGPPAVSGSVILLMWRYTLGCLFWVTVILLKVSFSDHFTVVHTWPGNEVGE